MRPTFAARPEQATSGCSAHTRTKPPSPSAMLRRLRDELVALLIICLVIRLCAWLIAPVLPMVIVLLFVLGVLARVVGERFF
jgi:hypothetical protein